MQHQNDERTERKSSVRRHSSPRLFPSLPRALTILAAGLVAAVPATAAQGACSMEGCRAYEMVSPVDKGGGDALRAATPDPFVAAEGDGNALIWSAGSAFAGATANNLNFYRSSRTSGVGWATRSITPPGVLPHPDLYRQIQVVDVVNGGADQILSTRQPLLPGDSFDPAPGSATVHLYYRRADGSITRITHGADGPLDPDSELNSAATYVTGTSSGSHVLFHARTHYDPSRPDAGDATVYRWTRATGQIDAVSVLPQDHPDYPGSFHVGGARSSGAGSGAIQAPYQISQDGEQVFFISPNFNVDTDDLPQLYVRDLASGVTTLVTKSQVTGLPGSSSQVSPLAAGATPDGSKALFYYASALTADAPVEGGLYEWARDSTPPLRLVAPGNGDGIVGGPAQHSGMVEASRDLSRVYYVTGSQIGGEGVPGEGNLFLLAGGAARLVATLPTSDANFASLVDMDMAFGLFLSGAWGSSWSTAESRVTPDGRWLAFATVAKLTDRETGGLRQIYLYGSDDGSLVCVSCPQNGSTPSGVAAMFSTDGAGTRYQPRNLSDDGRHLFFMTKSKLVSEDVNGRTDVYEWHDGEASLISGGVSNTRADYLASTPSGRDVFFRTFDRLSPADNDGGADIYNARIGGGFETPRADRQCADDACQGTPAPRTPGGKVASSGYHGAGDPTARARATLRVAAIGAAQRRRLARTGRLALAVTVPRAGRIVMTSNRGRRVAVRAKGAGTKRIVLTLTRRARRALAKRGQLRVRLTVRFGQSSKSRSLTLRSGK